MPRALRSLADTAALLLFLMPCTAPGWAQIEPLHGNTDRTYLALRDVTTGDQVLEVSNLVLNLSISLAQSGVDESFVMPVPIYLEMADGKIAPIGSLLLKGSATIRQDIPLSSGRTSHSPASSTRPSVP